MPLKLRDILFDTAFSPKRLEIEISETSLVDDKDAALAALAALQSFGMKISLRDFGTGYSSLIKFRELHFDKIKINRSFISSTQNSAGDSEIAGAMIALAKCFGLPVIAEGIEHLQELQEIVRRGGEFGQGFYFSEAISAAEARIMAQGGIVRAEPLP